MTFQIPLPVGTIDFSQTIGEAYYGLYIYMGYDPFFSTAITV